MQQARSQSSETITCLFCCVTVSHKKHAAADSAADGGKGGSYQQDFNPQSLCYWFFIYAAMNNG
jgi:hypothetical protein